MFIWYQYQLFIQEDILLCQCLSRNTSGTEIVKVLKTLLIIYPEPTVLMFSLKVQKQWWVKLLGLNTNQGSSTKLYGILHCYGLPVKKESISLKNILDEAVKILNIDPSVCVCLKLRDEMRHALKAILLHIEVQLLL